MSSKAAGHTGSTFDSFLEEEGLLEETEAVALKRVLAWQIRQEMQSQKVSKNAMASRLKTSRSQIERLLDPLHIGVTIETVTKAAHALGKRLRFEIVDARHSARPQSPARNTGSHTKKQRQTVARP